MSVLPNEETWNFITKFLSTFSADLTKFGRIDVTGVTGVLGGGRLTKNELVKGDISMFNNFLVGSFNERFRGFNEEGFITVISIFDLVVELNIVPGNEVTNFLFNLIVTLVSVNGTREIRGLGSMGENDALVLNLFAQSFLESDDVISTRSFHDGFIVFIIKINTINVGVIVNVISQLSGDGNRITRRITSSTESTDEKLFTILVELIQNVFLDFGISGTVIVGTNIGVDVSP